MTTVVGPPPDPKEARFLEWITLFWKQFKSVSSGVVSGLTLTAQAVGFTIAGGTTSKTLTVPLNATVSGTNTGDNNFADNETPAGTINGTDGTDGNAAFTLAHAPSPAGSLLLFKTDIGSGVYMIAGIHFNLTTLTITYTSGNKPITGMTHRASYRY